MFDMFLEKVKGKKGCPRCEGSGTYFFEGCSIFCELCHGESGINSLYKNIDSILMKTRMSRPAGFRRGARAESERLK